MKMIIKKYFIKKMEINMLIHLKNQKKDIFTIMIIGTLLEQILNN